MSKFSHQHYVEVARLLRMHFAYVNFWKLVFDFNKMFKKDNKNFDEKKFNDACIPKVLKRKKEVK